MSLTKYILQEGKKEIIIEKIGLPEHIAEYCMRYYDKRFVLYWASAIKDALSHGIDEELLKPTYTYEQFVGNENIIQFRMLEVFLKKPKLPKLPKEVLNKFKQKGDTPRVHFERAENYMGMYLTIRDYAEATNQNLQNADFREAVRDAIQWHEQVAEEGGSSKALQIEEGQEVIREFSDGYYWVDLGTSKCGKEGDSMGHCGNTGADTLLSLRDPKGVPHVTVACNYYLNRYIVIKQMKGKGNKKPIEKYHPYIVDFFVNGDKYKSEDILERTQYYEIRGYYPEYAREHDFSLLDLKDKFIEKIEQNDDDFEQTLFEWIKPVFKNLNKDIPQRVIEYMRENVDFLHKIRENGYIKYPRHSGTLKDDRWFVGYDENTKSFDLYLVNYKTFIHKIIVDDMDLFRKAVKDDKDAIAEVFKRAMGVDRSDIDFSDIDREGVEINIDLNKDFAIDWILSFNGIIDKNPVKKL